jgi:GNAT superfamily N-acetyltransferase
MWNIAEIRSTPSLELFSELVELLQDAVKSGASIGFLAPLSTADARNYWMAALSEVARGERVILLARDGTSIIGCAQLVLTVRANARHRAEIQKLIVHTQWQGKGLGRALLDAIETLASSKGRTLLLADAREGGYGDRLFARQGYTRVGCIPRYQRGSDGHFDSTVIFYRNLDTTATAM